MRSFQLKTKICFGSDSLKVLATLGIRRALLVTDPYFTKSGTAASVAAQLGDAEVTIFDTVTPDPTLEQAAQGARQLASSNAEAVIALGGGSPIDCAKAICALSAQPVRLIAIPTTSGSGSEVTAFSILTRGETKFPLVDDALLPELAILDPCFLATLPASLIADTGMDVLSHALEALAAKNATPFTDALSLSAIDLCLNHLTASYSGDLTMREQLHAAACMAGAAFNSAGLGVCHALAHALGARFHTPHGRLNAVLLPHVIRFNAHCCLERYALAAKNLSGATDSLRVRNLIRTVEQLRRKLSMPDTLRELGIDLSDCMDSVICDARSDLCLATNPCAVSDGDLRALLEAAG